MKTTKPLSRKSLKRSQPKRDWTWPLLKVEEEEACRVCVRSDRKLDAAHVIGRAHDRKQGIGSDVPGEPWADEPWPVQAERTVPLCAGPDGCHGKYDRHEIDLLGCLTPEEEAQAVIDADGLENARRRLAPSAYRSST